MRSHMRPDSFYKALDASIRFAVRMPGSASAKTIRDPAPSRLQSRAGYARQDTA